MVSIAFYSYSLMPNKQWKWPLQPGEACDKANYEKYQFSQVMCCIFRIYLEIISRSNIDVRNLEESDDGVS